ncbi:heterokaryon incompatibility protein-domain-containing protein [Pisolithus marmoratus]|nr:heterokaryon incompatibility protein-domain-containing protein [Pisolithus marmoratus]
MRLINVEAFLDFHEGKARPDAQILKEFNDSELAGTAYAALSHCWGKLEDEVQYTEMESLTNVDVATRGKIQRRSGYRKIRKACQQARRDDLHWLWVDTCCIDKRSSAELSEAINSMYVWYANSDGCFAFLHDVDAKTLPTEPDNRNFSESNGWPRWFSRGWTLQELIAPQDVHFFNQNWEYITRKRDSVDTLSVITRIATGVLKDGLEWSHASVAQIMSWAADRTTTRGEDRAYSLLGLLRVHMPMLYGEGKSAAFLRLQLEIIKTNNDQSIFAWGWKIKNKSASRFLADDPSYFRDCSNIHRITHVDFLNILEEYISKSRLHALLSTEKRLQTFAVTNHGIQIWLPLTRQSRTGPSELFSAMLACCEARGTKSRSSPITIAIEQFDHRSRSRCLGWPQVENQILPVKFKKILLPYRDNVNPTIRGPLKKQSTARFAFEDIIRSDSLIVVVGAAGSGKSNFIKKLTGTVPTTTIHLH